EVAKLALRAKQLDEDDAEEGIGIVAGDVGKAAAGKADVAIGEVEMHLGLARNEAGDMAGPDGDKEIVVIVLVEKRGIMRGDFGAVGLDVLIGKKRMMTRLGGDGHGTGRLPAGLHGAGKHKGRDPRRLPFHGNPPAYEESLA